MASPLVSVHVSRPIESEGVSDKIVSLEELEKRAIFSALDKLDGRRASAAEALGISKSSLYRKLIQYGSPPRMHSAKTEHVSEEIVRLEEIKKRAILSALRKLHGRKVLVAKALGMSRRSLYRKAKQYSWPPPTGIQTLRLNGKDGVRSVV
jgi:DNA-binding NtrC family response regulator